MPGLTTGLSMHESWSCCPSDIPVQSSVCNVYIIERVTNNVHSRRQCNDAVSTNQDTAITSQTLYASTRTENPIVKMVQ